MQDRTIDNALLALRKKLTQERGKGLEQVKTLLRQRRVSMPPVPRKQRAKMPRGTLKRAVLAMLREGPKTRAQIIERLQEDGTRPLRAEVRADSALATLRRQGLVEKCEGGWRVVDDLRANNPQAPVAMS